MAVLRYSCTAYFVDVLVNAYSHGVCDRFSLSHIFISKTIAAGLNRCCMGVDRLRNAPPAAHGAKHHSHITDVGAITPVGGVWTFWVRQERSPRELASALSAALGTAAEARGAVRGAVHLLSRSGVSVSKTTYVCGLPMNLFLVATQQFTIFPNLTIYVRQRVNKRLRCLISSFYCFVIRLYDQTTATALFVCTTCLALHQVHSTRRRCRSAAVEAVSRRQATI